MIIYYSNNKKTLNIYIVKKVHAITTMQFLLNLTHYLLRYVENNFLNNYNFRKFFILEHN